MPAGSVARDRLLPHPITAAVVAVSVDRVGRVYVGTYTKDATGGELIKIANESHQNVVTALETTFARLVNNLEASAPEVAATATYYLQTDRRAADVIDRALPGALGQCQTSLEYEFASIVCKPVPFSDPSLVTGRLTAPPEPDSPSNSLGFMRWPPAS